MNILAWVDIGGSSKLYETNTRYSYIIMLLFDEGHKYLLYGLLQMINRHIILVSAQIQNTSMIRKDNHIPLQRLRR